MAARLRHELDLILTTESGARSGRRQVNWLPFGAWLLAGVAAIYYVCTLNWRVQHDLPLMIYIGARISEGAVPYRDIVDMNMPGVYWLHALAWRLIGLSDPGYRIMDGLFLLADGLAMHQLLRRFRAGLGLFAAAAFAMYHLSCGASNALQRDFLAVLPLLLSAVCLLQAEERRQGILYLAAGGLVGVATLFKPTYLLLGLAWPLLILFEAGQASFQARLFAGVKVMAGVLAVLLPAFAVLLYQGAWQSFVRIWLDFIIPVYLHLRVPDESALTVIPQLRWRLLHWAPAVLLTPLLLLSPRHRTLTGLMLVLMLVSLLSLITQDRGWLYHAYPLAASLTMLGVIGLDALIGVERPGLQRLCTGMAMLVVAATFYRLGPFAGKRLADQLLEVPEPVLLGDRIAGDLRPFVVAGDPVQVLDMTSGGVLALLETHTRLPTPFLYGFSVLADLDTPRRARSRERFLEVLNTAPPKAIVLTTDEWPSLEPGYRRLAKWPEFQAVLDQRYELRRQWPRETGTLAPHGYGYRLWVRRDPSILPSVIPASRAKPTR